MRTILIVILIIVVIIAALFFAASWLFNRNNNAADTPAAKARGAEMIKNSQVIVAVGAHPDDLEYYTGGTLGTLAAAGKRVIGVTSADLSVIQATRRAEGTKAAHILGYTPIFLGHPERDYKGSKGLSDKDRKEIRAEIIAIIKKYHADTLIAYDSNDQAPIYHHIDHIRTGIEAQAAAKETGLKNVYLYSTGDPNTRVDTSSMTVKKGQAIAAHVSQQDRRWIRLARFLFGWIRPAASTPAERFVSAAESFRKI
jgi:LmbE family N-acetylglucosaminyl deacetylase